MDTQPVESSALPSFPLESCEILPKETDRDSRTDSQTSDSQPPLLGGEAEGAGLGGPLLVLGNPEVVLSVYPSTSPLLPTSGQNTSSLSPSPALLEIGEFPPK